MNKISKIGLSALCGSLASVSVVNAGALDVTGTADLTWTSLGGQVNGNPIGMNTGLSFTGSGELDGGQTFSVLMAHTDKATWSSSNITLTTNSAGSFKLSSAEGGQGIGGYDDNMPRAWEEVWDTGIATNANFQKGVGSSTNISWTSPKIIGTKVQIAYAPDNDGVQNANKGVSGSASDHFAAGWDIVLDTGTANGGVNLFLGISETQVASGTPAAGLKAQTKAFTNDHEEGVVGLQFIVGPVAFGGQVSAERLQTQTANATSYYANSSWGIAFNVSDDLSVSYSEARHVQSKTKKQTWNKDSRGSENHNEYHPKAWMNGDSIQVAYTIGGVGIKYAQSDYDNTAYGFDTKTPRSARLVGISLAF